MCNVLKLIYYDIIVGRVGVRVAAGEFPQLMLKLNVKNIYENINT